MKRLIFALILMGALRAGAQVSISASSVTDSFNNPVASARLCFMPVNAAMQPTGFRVGSQQVIPTEVCGTVTNGVLITGKTLAPSAAGLYYHIYLKPIAANTIIRDYGMTPITGSTWTLDAFDPTLVTVPFNTLTMGVVTSLPPGSNASCTLTGSSPYALNCQIPQATGGPGSGLGDPGSNGLVKRTAFNVTGVAGYADVVGLWPSCTSGYLKYDGTCSTPSGTGGMTYPSAGLGASTGSAWRSPTFSDVIALWASGSCTSGYLKYDGTCSNPSGTRGSMSWPGAPGIAVYSGGSAWGTSLSAPVGPLVGTTDTQTLTNKTLDGVTPATMAFLDATSSLQTQLNGKAASNASTTVNGTACALGSSCTATAAAGTLTGSSLAVGVTASSLTSAAGGSFGTGAYAAAYALPTQYKVWTCETGLGDGLNVISAGTYLQSFCYNTTGTTVTLTGVKCSTDNSGSSSLNVAGNTLGALLTGPVTCSQSFASGTQSGNVLLTANDYIKFTFVSDGVSKQTTWTVTGTY